MKKTKKILELAALAAAATGIIHILNKQIEHDSQKSNLLPLACGHFYKWKFGNVYYTKLGSGQPLLLVHDAVPGSSGFEWSEVEKKLAKDHTVYVVDLPGCGRSAKPAIEYTNFLFVLFLRDFTENVIGEKTDVIASGLSSSFVIMAPRHEKELFKEITLVNPVDLRSLRRTLSFRGKLMKRILDFPVFGTLLYYMNVSRETFSTLFMDKFYLNPFHTQKAISYYYEASHKGGHRAKYFYSSLAANYMNLDISRAVSETTIPVLIIEGESEEHAKDIVRSYQKLNPAITAAYVGKSKHFPQLENASEFLKCVIHK